MIVGELIRKAREGRFKSAQSKASLARKLGISTEFLRRIELGESYPSGELFARIAAATRMSAKDASRCWEAIGLHQLDDPTRGQVVLYGANAPKLPPGLMAQVTERVTTAALDWVGLHYHVSEGDLARMRKEVSSALENP